MYEYNIVGNNIESGDRSFKMARLFYTAIDDSIENNITVVELIKTVV